jgi:hypothetical protein
MVNPPEADAGQSQHQEYANAGPDAELNRGSAIPVRKGPELGILSHATLPSREPLHMEWNSAQTQIIPRPTRNLS